MVLIGFLMTFGFMKPRRSVAFSPAPHADPPRRLDAFEAVERLINPAPILAGPMLVIAVLGLVVNGGVFYMLMQGERR